MPEEISLKLCLLTTLVEKSGEEVENETSIPDSENDHVKEDKRNSISAVASTRDEAKKHGG